MNKKLIILLLGIGFALSAAEPVLRIGILSDSHLNKKSANESTISALKHLASKKIDVLLHTGDFCDGQPEMLTLFTNEVKRAFQEKMPETLYVLGNHDVWLEPDIASGKNADLTNAGINFKKYLGVKTLYPMLTVKGYTFIGFPFSHYGTDALRKKIRELTDAALKKHPSNPVFVVSHISPPDSVWYMSEERGSEYSYGYTKDILFRNPRFINITGHSHADLTDDRNFWQGQCTVINAGSSLYQFLYAEVFPEKIVIRRFFAVSGREIAPDSPWQIALPMKAVHPEVFGRRWKQAPLFSPSAKLTVTPGRTIHLAFPAPQGDDQMLTYTAKFYHQRKLVQERSFLRNFRDGTELGKNSINWDLPGGILTRHGKYTVELTAENGGKFVSRPLSAAFTVPASKTNCIWQESLTDREKAETLDIRGKSFRLPVQGKGFVIQPRNDLQIHFPEETVKQMRGKKGYVLLNVETDRCMRQCFNFHCGKVFRSERIPVSTPFAMDYCCEFECAENCTDPFLSIRNWWGEGTVLIRNLRIFLYN